MPNAVLGWGNSKSLWMQITMHTNVQHKLLFNTYKVSTLIKQSINPKKCPMENFIFCSLLVFVQVEFISNFMGENKFQCRHLTFLFPGIYISRVFAFFLKLVWFFSVILVYMQSVTWRFYILSSKPFKRHFFWGFELTF